MLAQRRFLTTAVVAALLTFATVAGAQQAKVRAVLFFSPTCPHCHVVMEQHLPPIMERFGDRFQIVTINVSTPEGGRLYQDVVEAYAVPRSRLGVPAMVVGDRVLVGADEIPQRLPDIVEAGLAGTGIDWPQVAALRSALARAGLLEPLQAPAAPPAESQTAVEPEGIAETHASPTPPDALAPRESSADAAPPAASESTAADSEAVASPAAAGQLLRDVTADVAPATMMQRFMRDPAGNAVAVLVLAGLVLALAWSVYALGSGARPTGQVPAWLIPVLVLCGIGVASYLSFVEVTGSAAVCGPVGDCNTVQQSPYASLFGFLPVGVLGLLGYVLIGSAWAASRHGPPDRRRLASLVLWGAALVGTAFSAYLTFLEPFVIGATCVWCLTSAAITAVILLVATSGVAPRYMALERPRNSGLPGRVT